jgi:transcriptional regulator with PAS, ATPase and Fis domain
MPSTANRGRPERGQTADLSGRDPFLRNIVGASPKMQRVFRLVAKVAPTDSSVLLLGESGTGKELLARSIHLQSRRSEGPFVAVNVGALPDALIESELFGYVRGAFTGAAGERTGLIESADEGTLFLDEIGDMPLTTQVKLLRTLESNELRRLGDSALRMVDVRVVAATHRNLLLEAEEGRFRHDLYYRLNVVQIHLPPLRERREDIGLLASYFLDRAAERAGRAPKRFSPEVETLLERHDWPGNVRELENAVEHAVAVGEGPVVRPLDLPTAVRSPRLLSRGSGVRGEATAGPWGSETPEALSETASGDVDPRSGWSLAQVEADHMRRVLTRHRGNATAAARQLGISRTTLWRKLRQYGIRRTDF